MTNRITCVKKDPRQDPYKRITDVGFLNSKGSHRASQEQVIQWIDEGYPFYVEVGGRRVDVVVKTSRFGNKYIRTEADNDEPNNLLSLMECVG